MGTNLKFYTKFRCMPRRKKDEVVIRIVCDDLKQPTRARKRPVKRRKSAKRVAHGKRIAKSLNRDEKGRFLPKSGTRKPPVRTRRRRKSKTTLEEESLQEVINRVRFPDVREFSRRLGGQVRKRAVEEVKRRVVRKVGEALKGFTTGAIGI